MYGILLVAALIVTGGAIAFIGDRVGSKVGKKKLSLFGLRPRHTSVIVTVVTGVLITTLTFAVLAAVSENVRVALFGMEKLNTRMQKTQNDLAAAGEKLTIAEKAQMEANLALAESRAKVEELGAREAELTVKTEELEAGNKELEDEKATLTATNEELSARSEKLAADAEALAEEGRVLEERAKRLREGLVMMREGDIIFRAGEVLASGVVKGGRDIETVRRDIDSLMEIANRASAARLGSNNKTSEIWIYTPEYEKAAEVIAKGDNDMVVRIVAAGNLLRGEPVRTLIELFKNSTIYKKGEFIAARPFEIKGAGQSEAERMLMDFLKDVNSAAQDKGIIPDPIRGSVGIIEGTQFYDVVEALSKIKGAAVLSAYAREETNALGPLRLNIKLEAEASE